MRSDLLSVVMVVAGSVVPSTPAVAGATASACPGYESNYRNGVVGTSGDEFLFGTEGDDIICGLGGNDVIDGKGGNDWLIGGEGDDRLSGRLGDDLYSGGPGSDWADYYGTNADLSVNLAYYGTYGAASGEGTDRLYDIENVMAGGGDDRITGNSRANFLRGELGEDLIQGREGNDLLHGSGSNDILRGEVGDDVLFSGTNNERLEGGSGIDTASYGGFNTTDGVSVNLSYHGAYGPGAAAKGFNASLGRDVLVSVENVNGTFRADRLTGDARANVLYGGGLDDLIQGLGGDDRLFGAGDNDVLRGGAGNDRLDGGQGTDTCDGGPGTNTRASCE